MTRVSTRTRQDAARLALGAMLVLAGASHLTVARREFRAQVPPWIPMDTDDVVLLSGAAEIALGAALAGLPKERRRVGGLAAAFFTAIFPGNISQYRNRVDGFRARHRHEARGAAGRTAAAGRVGALRGRAGPAPVSRCPAGTGRRP
ncbi:hypothetical protein [Pseudonocardia sp. ICBG1293]|uniref:DoxX family protein n=1 Tax=Pseudonocardia sp. ICBG1293 TaxID=2844382 RepID=UPI001CCFC048|nr:hypothetical protein [Pseudonocardia sp. ICBG1293]